MTKKNKRKKLNEITWLFAKAETEAEARKGSELIRKLIATGSLTKEEETEAKGYGEGFQKLIFTLEVDDGQDKGKENYSVFRQAIFPSSG